MFRLPDGDEKNERYITHILDNQPDVLILAFGGVDADNVWHAFPNEHSPFNDTMPAAVFTAFRDYGIRYDCTFYAPLYELHVGINIDSPQFDAIHTALDDFCLANGYILENGLTIETGGEMVYFPPAAVTGR